MGLILDDEDGQTPLDEEEKNGLLISTIITHGELNEFEQHNIEDALLWVLGRSFNADQVLKERFIRKLHHRMYGKVWSWAGEFRKTDKNIGVTWHSIPVALKQLLDDIMFWHKNKTFVPDEIAIRYKHKLVSIHCFSNGNGRHSRLMADLIIEKIYALPVFTWGAANLTRPGDARTAYIQALKAADQGDYSLLLAFARS
jgi:Fic-DOC domain mobile mystery protein B